jgi:redox-sensing transcriptional repressor
MNDKIKNIPRPTLQRLPLYRRDLKQRLAEGNQSVSCTDIAHALGLDPTQVRKDVACTGIVGKPRVGYVVAELLRAIEDFLGWNNTSDAFLVGAGHLGTALIGYEDFRNYGLNIVAAFDVDTRKIGTTIDGREVFALERLADLAQRMHTHIGILCVPAPAAQMVANLMVMAGMEAIWNFAPVRLEVPEEIIVENVDLRASLALLTSRLIQRFQPSSGSTIG